MMYDNKEDSSEIRNTVAYPGTFLDSGSGSSRSLHSGGNTGLNAGSDEACRDSGYICAYKARSHCNHGCEADSRTHGCPYRASGEPDSCRIAYICPTDTNGRCSSADQACGAHKTGGFLYLSTRSGRVGCRRLC